MSDLHKALSDIRSIRRQVAGTTQFHGYGPATMAATGGAALVAAGVQARWVPDAPHHMRAYLALWAATAAVAAVVAAMQMLTRSRRMHSGLSDEMIRMAAEQFLPALGAGVLLTLVLVLVAPGVLWMLPGLWQVVYSLGIFSSCRFLPRTMLAAAGWYLLCGLVCLALGNARALEPWTMGVAFGAGQTLVAAVLLTVAPEGEGDDDGE